MYNNCYSAIFIAVCLYPVLPYGFVSVCCWSSLFAGSVPIFCHLHLRLCQFSDCRLFCLLLIRSSPSVSDHSGHCLAIPTVPLLPYNFLAIILSLVQRCLYVSLRFDCLAVCSSCVTVCLAICPSSLFDHIFPVWPCLSFWFGPVFLRSNKLSVRSSLWYESNLGHNQVLITQCKEQGKWNRFNVHYYTIEDDRRC